jgi:hypothetical protein
MKLNYMTDTIREKSLESIRKKLRNKKRKQLLRKKNKKLLLKLRPLRKRRKSPRNDDINTQFKYSTFIISNIVFMIHHKSIEI